MSNIFCTPLAFAPQRRHDTARPRMCRALCRDQLLAVLFAKEDAATAEASCKIYGNVIDNHFNSLGVLRTSLSHPPPQRQKGRSIEGTHARVICMYVCTYNQRISCIELFAFLSNFCHSVFQILDPSPNRSKMSILVRCMHGEVIPDALEPKAVLEANAAQPGNLTSILLGAPSTLSGYQCMGQSQLAVLRHSAPSIAPPP